MARRLSSVEFNVSVLQRRLRPKQVGPGFDWGPDVRFEMAYDRAGHFYNRFWRTGIGLRAGYRGEAVSHTLRVGLYRLGYWSASFAGESNPYGEKLNRVEALYTVGASW